MRCCEKVANAVSRSLLVLAFRGQQRFRDGEAERLGGFEVDHHLDFCSLLNRQIGWFLALENAPGIEANLVVRIVEVAAIAHQAPGLGEFTVREQCGQRMAGRERRKLFRVPVEKGAGAGDKDRTRMLLRQSCERHFEITIGPGVQNNRFVSRICGQCLAPVVFPVRDTERVQ